MVSKTARFEGKALSYGRAVTPLATADAAHYVREIPPRPPNVLERLI